MVHLFLVYCDKGKYTLTLTYGKEYITRNRLASRCSSKFPEKFKTMVNIYNTIHKNKYTVVSFLSGYGEQDAKYTERYIFR